jgi:GT2 family glycosyltransferase
MTDQVLVASVIIPAYNAAETLGDQLRALAAQVDAPAFEVIVADNGSTDDTADVAAAFNGRFGTLRHIDASARRGPCAARNLGAAAATTDRLLFCDADDVAGPRWVSAMVEALNGADLVGGKLLDDELNPPHVRSWYAGTPSALFEKYERFLSYASGASLGIRRAVFDQIGGWDETFANATDADLCFRAQLDAAATIDFAPAATMQYRYRHDLSSLARNMRAYGQADAQLVARFRSSGLTGRSAAQVAKSWLWLVVHLPGAAISIDRRGNWLRRANIALGRAVGGVRHRVLV